MLTQPFWNLLKDFKIIRVWKLWECCSPSALFARNTCTRVHSISHEKKLIIFGKCSEKKSLTTCYIHFCLCFHQVVNGRNEITQMKHKTPRAASDCGGSKGFHSCLNTCKTVRRYNVYKLFYTCTPDPTSICWLKE